MKILTCMGEAGPLTGAPRRLLALVHGLRKLQVDVTVAAPNGSELFNIEKVAGYTPVDISPKGILAIKNRQLLTNKNILFRLKIIARLIQSNFSFYKILRKEKFDALWIRGSGSFAKYGLALFFARVKVIWDVDDELPSHGIVRLFHEIGMVLSHRVIFQYRGTERKIFNESLNKRYQKKYLTLVPGIKTTDLEPQEKNINTDKTIKFIHVGTINRRKNQAFTLKLLGDLKENHPSLNFTVQFAGFLTEESYKPEIDNIIQKFDLEKRIEFLGWRDDVTKLVANSDVMLMPSLSEGVPNTVQEAMALGIPVVASTAGGIPEIIENGKTGYSLGLGTFEDWQATLESLIINPELRRQIGRNAKKYALQNFSNEVWVSRYYDIINELINS